MHKEKHIKKWVWVPHSSLTYIPAFINTQTDKETTVTTQDNQTLTLATCKVQEMNPIKFNMTDDLAVLSFLNDPSVLHNLRMRYEHDLIYTYSGLFLVAVNPYKEIKNLYSKETIESYKNKKLPHIFAVANDAYENMVTNKEDQSILITGESGAGKTVNTKKVITFLAHIANKEQNDSSVTEEIIANKILETNNILEAFGNAQTVKNDNSSRFGKFIKISFVNGKITGCNIEKYLLEKSRITRANTKERNYHIFYYLLEALRKNDKHQRKNIDKSDVENDCDTRAQNDKYESTSYKYGGGVYDEEYVEFLDVLKKAALFDSISLSDYNYTKDTNKTIKDVDDALEFYKLNRSMDILEFTRDEKISIFKILAAILYLGNLEFKEENDQAHILNEEEAERVCQLLRIPLKKFLNILLTPTTIAGKELVVNSRTKEQVVNIVEALSRLLYERVFDLIIEKINTVLGKEKFYNKNDSNFIGVLDIAGFEIFEKNDFEQLCINFTNEKLQQFFNHHMFILEQEIYKRENIDWNFIDFGLDLQPTIDLIEKSNPIGVFSFLDEECVMPKGSDLTFLEKLRDIENRGFKRSKKRVTFTGVSSRIKDNTGAKKDEEVTSIMPGQKQIFELSKLKEGFMIEHYAGKVEYLVDQWLKKNKDPHFDYLSTLLKHSEDVFVSELFTFDTSGKKGFFRTVSQKHKDSLNLLMNTLRKTNPFFVRCLLPNNQKKSNLFINSLILHQLKCNGVMEGIRISRQGYPTRILFKEFRRRYGILCKENEEYVDNKEASLKILAHIKEHLKSELTSAEDIYKVGNTMLFFKQGVLAGIEELRDAAIVKIAVEIQSLIRRRLTIQRVYLEEIRCEAIKVIQKNARLSVIFRNWNWWKLFLKVKPLLNISKMEDELRQKEGDYKRLAETLRLEKLRCDDLIERMNKSIDNKAALETELEKERLVILEKEDLLMALREENQKTKDCLKENEKEVQKLKEQFTKRSSEQEEQRKTMESKLKSFETENLDLRDKYKLLEASSNKTQKDSKLSNSKFVSEKETEIKKLSNEIEVLKNNYSNKEKNTAVELKNKQTNINQLLQNVKKAEERVLILESELQEMKKNVTEKCAAQDDAHKAQISKLKNTCDKLESKNKEYDNNVRTQVSEINELKNNIEILNDEKVTLMNDNQKLKSKIQSLTDDIEIEMAKSGASINDNEEMNSKIELLVKEKRRLVDDLEAERQKNNNLIDRCDKMAKEFKITLQTKLDENDALESQFKAQKQKFSKRVAQLESEIKGFAKQESAVDRKLMDIEIERRKTLEKDFNHLESEHIASMHTNEVQKMEMLKMEKMIINLKNSLSESESKNERLAGCQKEISVLKQTIGDNLKKQSSTFYKLLEEYRTENTDLKSKINFLKSENEDKKNEKEALEKVCDEIKSSRTDLKNQIVEMQAVLSDEREQFKMQNDSVLVELRVTQQQLMENENKLRQSKNDLERMSERIKDFERQSSISTNQQATELKQSKDAIKKLTEINAELESKLNSLKCSSGNVDYICSHCTFENCNCDENCLIKCNKSNQYRKTIDDLKMQLCYEQDRGRLLKDQHKRLQGNYDTFTVEYNDLYESMKNYRSTFERLQKELYNNKEMLRNVKNENMQFKNNIMSLADDNKHLKNLCDKLQSESIQAPVEPTPRKLYDISLEIEKSLRMEAEEQARCLREEVDALSKINAGLSCKIDKFYKKDERSDSEVYLLRNDIATLKKMLNESASVNERLKRELRDERMIAGNHHVLGK